MSRFRRSPLIWIHARVVLQKLSILSITAIVIQCLFRLLFSQRHMQANETERQNSSDKNLRRRSLFHHAMKLEGRRRDDQTMYCTFCRKGALSWVQYSLHTEVYFRNFSKFSTNIFGYWPPILASMSVIRGFPGLDPARSTIPNPGK